MSEQPDRADASRPERRQNVGLRATFEEAFSLIEPFFDPVQGWAGRSLAHLAYRIVRENFPVLSADEVHVLVVAAHRAYIERHPHASNHLQHPRDFHSTVV